MARLKLTQTMAEKAPVSESTRIIFDSDLAGFGLRVTPAGAKSWVVEYRPGAGGRGVSKKRVTLGSLEVLKAEAARSAAKVLLARVRLGRDPAGEKARLRETPTVAQFVDTFISEEVSVRRAARTAVGYESDLRRYVVPPIGALRLTEVKKADVMKLHRRIGKERPVRANRVIAALSSMYRYAAAAGAIEEGINPCIGVDRFREEGKERFLDTGELERLGATLRLAETEGLPWSTDDRKVGAKHLAREENRRHVISPFATAAIRLLLFTGCRLREILHLRWNEVDFDRGLLLLPTSKTGKKAVILSAPALTVLNELPRIGQYVIAGGTAGNKEEKPRSDLKRPWTKISEHAGLVEVRLHDLRHSFASVGAGGGLGLQIIGKLLWHARAETTQRLRIWRMIRCDARPTGSEVTSLPRWESHPVAQIS